MERKTKTNNQSDGNFADMKTKGNCEEIFNFFFHLLYNIIAVFILMNFQFTKITRRKYREMKKVCDNFQVSVKEIVSKG